MSNLNLTDEEIRDRLAAELGLDSLKKQYNYQELMQMWLATGQPFDKGLLTWVVNGSAQALALTHNNPVYNHGSFIWIPATDRYIRLEASGYITKTSGNTTRGIARCQLYNMQSATAQDSDSVLVPLENLANEGIGVLKASFLIQPSHQGRVYGAGWDVFQYAGSLTATLYNGTVGAVNLQAQLKAFML